MKKIYFSEKTGSIYWLEKIMHCSKPILKTDILYSAPLPNKDGIIDIEDEGYEVDLELLKGDKITDDILAEEFFGNIIEKLK